MNGYSPTVRTAKVRVAHFPAALVATLLLLVFTPSGPLAPPGASGAPQGPWVLPAGDLSGTGQDATEPQVAIGPDGSATVVWYRFDGSNYIVQASTRLPGGAFGLPVDLSATGQHAFDPRIAIGPDGSATVVWYRDDGTHNIVQASTRPPGGAFGPPVDLSATGHSAEDPQIAIGLDGSATAVWYRFDGSYYIVQASTRPPGGAFAAPVDLSATGQTALNPQIATAPDGSATAIWRRFNGSNYIVQASTRPPGGAFGLPVDLSATGRDALSPQIATAPDGSTTVVWYRSNGVHDIVQVSTRPPGGAFGPPVDLSATGRNAANPQIAAAPDGSATAVWYRLDGSNYIVQASTRPPGGAFGLPVDLSATGQHAFDPRIAIGPDGSATAVWYRDNGSNFIIQSASTAQPHPALSVSRSGGGKGKVTSSPEGIDCGVDCAEDFPSYTKVTLAAAADPGSNFTGWTGACSGTMPICEVTMLKVETVNARFKIRSPICRKATLRLGKLKLNRRRGVGRLKVKAGMAGKVTLKRSKRVKRSSKKLKRKGAVWLRVKARGRARRKLNRRGKVKVKVRVRFRPAGTCKAKSRTRKVKLRRRTIKRMR